MVWISGITTNAIILSAYAIGNAAGSFMWKKKYQPRYDNIINRNPWLLKSQTSFLSNHVPWAIIAACIGTCAILILSLRYLLHFENIRRDGEQRDETYDNIYLMQESEDGTVSEKPVDKVQISISLNLTDLLTM